MICQCVCVLDILIPNMNYILCAETPVSSTYGKILCFLSGKTGAASGLLPQEKTAYTDE